VTRTTNHLLLFFPPDSTAREYQRVLSCRDDLSHNFADFGGCIVVINAGTVLLEFERRGRACTSYERRRLSKGPCEGEPKMNYETLNNGVYRCRFATGKVI
jgi:hypothetical protein